MIPVVGGAEDCLLDPSDGSIGVRHRQIDGNAVTTVVFVVVPDLPCLHGSAALQGGIGVGGDDVGLLGFLIEADTVNGKAAGNCAGGILGHLHLIACCAGFIQGQTDDAVGHGVIGLVRGKGFFDIIGIARAQTPHIGDTVFHRKDIGGIIAAVVGGFAGPELGRLGACCVGIDGELGTVQQVPGQEVFLLDAEAEPGRQIEVDRTVGLGGAALQIVDSQGVVAGSDTFQIVGQGLVDSAVNGDDTGGEIHVTAFNAVDTTQIQHQLVVYEDPDIVIAGELEVHVSAVQVLVAAASGIVGQVELDVHAHTKVKVCTNRGICGLRFVEIVGGAYIFALVAIVAVSSGGVAVGVGVGGVQGQKIGVGASTLGGVGGAFQIVVDIEASITLVIGGGVQGGVVIIVTVMGITGVRHQLEQMIRSAQILLADDTCSGGRIERIVGAEEQISQIAVVQAAVEIACVAPVGVMVVGIDRVGNILAALVPVTEDEVQGGLAVVGIVAGG